MSVRMRKQRNFQVSTSKLTPRVAANAPPRTLIFLCDQVKSAVAGFLQRERMSCPATQEGLVGLINALSHYTEEGRALFPEVFILDNLRSALSVIPGSEHICVGAGPREPETVAKALKKCAPLARLGWCVYIERSVNEFKYGLIRQGTTVLSLGAAEVLVEGGDASLPVLMVRQIGKDVIELRGCSGSSLVVHFGAARTEEISPLPALNRFISLLVQDVAADVQEPTATFYRNVVTVVAHAGHGTLAAVVSGKRRALPRQFTDAIRLEPIIYVAQKVSEVLLTGDCQSNTQLLAYNALITGMLLSDGITVFGSDGTVRAYNVFVTHPHRRSGEAIAGGARHRTFAVLSSLVKNGKLMGALIQSQDGRTDFSGSDQYEK